MVQVPAGLKYTKDHEWAKIEGTVATVGITDHAQHELGDIVFLELPKVGAQLKRVESFGEIEAVKTVAPLYAPVSGRVMEVNQTLADKAEVINADPYEKGWIVKVELSTPSEIDSLLDAESYKRLI